MSGRRPPIRCRRGAVDVRRVTTQLLTALGRISEAHPWSHNDAYSSWILWHARRIRRRGAIRALDAGCGTGNLLKKLAREMGEVTGIEQDPETARRARRNVAAVRSVVVREESFDLTPCENPCYDLVTLVAVLYHLPLAPALDAARSLIRPGGRMLIVGLARETSSDLPWSVASLFLNPLIGVIRHPRRVAISPENMTAPTTDPRETFEQIKATAQRMLPGVKMRRSLFWRYTAVWIAPM